MMLLEEARSNQKHSEMLGIQTGVYVQSYHKIGLEAGLDLASKWVSVSFPSGRTWWSPKLFLTQHFALGLKPQPKSAGLLSLRF